MLRYRVRNAGWPFFELTPSTSSVVTYRSLLAECEIAWWKKNLNNCPKKVPFSRNQVFTDSVSMDRVLKSRSWVASSSSHVWDQLSSVKGVRCVCMESRVRYDFLKKLSFGKTFPDIVFCFFVVVVVVNVVGIGASTVDSGNSSSSSLPDNSFGLSAS